MIIELDGSRAVPVGATGLRQERKILSRNRRLHPVRNHSCATTILIKLKANVIIYLIAKTIQKMNGNIFSNRWPTKRPIRDIQKNHAARLLQKCKET